MDLTSIASSTSSSIADAGVSQNVQIDLLKRAMNIDQQSISTLIDAIPQTSSTQNLPPNLGNNVNAVA